MNKICLLGLGYIGLPTGSMFALAGKSVVGVDPSPRVHVALSSGLASIDEPELQTLVTAAINSGRLRVQTKPEAADAFIIAVPTPLDPTTNRADLTFVRQAARDIVPFLRRGNLVVLESTVPPGTTRDVLTPILAESGLVPGQDIFVAHCPERVLPGRILVELEQNDRLAGGLTPACAERAADLYQTFVKGAIMRTDATTAEMVKVMENTFRDVNVAMPEHVVARLAELVAPPAAVALLGVTYKAEVDDVRESPALRVAELVVERGFAVRLCDPHVKADTPGLPAPLLPLEQALRDAEAVVLLVDHRAFQELDVDLVAALVSGKRVLDARNSLDRATWQARGFEVI